MKFKCMNPSDEFIRAMQESFGVTRDKATRILKKIKRANYFDTMGQTGETAIRGFFDEIAGALKKMFNIGTLLDGDHTVLYMEVGDPDAVTFFLSYWNDGNLHPVLYHIGFETEAEIKKIYNSEGGKQ